MLQAQARPVSVERFHLSAGLTGLIRMTGTTILMVASLLPTLVLALLTLLTPAAIAQEEPGTYRDKLGHVWSLGPQVVNIDNDLAILDLPKGYAFLGKEDTRDLMTKAGNPITNREVAMVMPAADDPDWFMIFEFNPVGYVKDDEKDDLDADGLLAILRESTDEDNKERKGKGMLPLNIVGWFEDPHYNKLTHNLEWAIMVEEEQTKHQTINVDTRLLGRTGVMSLTLVVPPDKVTTSKPEFEEIISRFEFQDGKRYADFQPGQDKVAEYGLAALIAGGVGTAAVKTGFFAKFILPILLGMKKFVVVIIAAFAGLVTWLKNMMFGKSDDE